MRFESSVNVDLDRISMKFQSLIAAIVVTVIELAGQTSSSCLLRNGGSKNTFWYQCFRVEDNELMTELKKAPIDVDQLSFSISNTPIIPGGSFHRLGKNLKTLQFSYCGVKEIGDHAFKGLTNLEILAFVGNKIEVIRGAWFVGLSSLKKISFGHNFIKQIEDNVFSNLPPLDLMDISYNRLACIPIDSIGNWKTRQLNIEHNPFTWTCDVLLMKWLKNTDIGGDFRDLRNLDESYELATICASKLPKDRLNERLLNECVADEVRNYLPNKENYTVKQVCEFIKGKHSPFLNCTE